MVLPSREYFSTVRQLLPDVKNIVVLISKDFKHVHPSIIGIKADIDRNVIEILCNSGFHIRSQPVSIPRIINSKNNFNILIYT